MTTYLLDSNIFIQAKNLHWPTGRGKGLVPSS
jgi:hypothetical protein